MAAGARWLPPEWVDSAGCCSGGGSGGGRLGLPGTARAEAARSAGNCRRSGVDGSGGAARMAQLTDDGNGSPNGHTCLVRVKVRVKGRRSVARGRGAGHVRQGVQKVCCNGTFVQDCIGSILVHNTVLTQGLYWYLCTSIFCVPVLTQYSPVQKYTILVQYSAPKVQRCTKGVPLARSKLWLSQVEKVKRKHPPNLR